jgi:hypothetical protein
METQRQSADRSRAAGSGTDQQSPIRTGYRDQSLNRRRALHVLGSLAAAAAGAAALSAVQSEEASANGPTLFSSSTSATPVTAENTAGYIAILATGSGGGSSYATVSALNSGTDGVAVYGESDASGAYAVQGSSLFGYGVVGYGGTASVYGYTNSNNGIGVLGTNSSDSSPAIQGINYAKGPGLQGNSTHNIGVWGVTSSSGQGLANPAVAGSNDGGGAGLVGFTAGPSSIGLGGATDSGIGAYGSSQSGLGLFGYSNTGIAIYGISPSGGNAGYFNGPVFITGSLTATGAKSAAVRSRGELRRVYSLESPESWFEDFGSGQLMAGQTTVTLEPGFADIVHTDAYRVFLTPRGESKGWLYVSKQSPSGFTVQEAAGGTSNIAFDYRVVAKRADIEGARLEKVDAPRPIDGPQEPVLDHAPKPPPTPAPVHAPDPGSSAPGR